MPQFEVGTYPSQIFWLLVCFVFLSIVMARYLVPRLTAALMMREQRLQDDWHQVKNFKSQEETLKNENLAHLAEARGKAHVLIHQALQEVQQIKFKRLAVLDEELQEKTKKIRDGLDAQTQKIRKNMEPIVAYVAVATAPRVLGQSLTHVQLKTVIQGVLKKEEQI